MPIPDGTPTTAEFAELSWPDQLRAMRRLDNALSNMTGKTYAQAQAKRKDGNLLLAQFVAEHERQWAQFWKEQDANTTDRVNPQEDAKNQND